MRIWKGKKMAVRVNERNVPDTQQNAYLRTATKAKSLAIHTIKNCSNKKIFSMKRTMEAKDDNNTSERYQEQITDEMVKSAIQIYKCVRRANEIRVEDSKKNINTRKREERKRLQENAKAYCNNLLDMLSLAKTLFHLRGKKVAYWTDKITEVRNSINSWRESDQKRYG